MELITAAALIFLLCFQIQNTGAFPVRHNLEDTSGNGKQGSFVRETVAAKTRNENPPCQIFPVTDDPLTTTPLPPISVKKLRQTPLPHVLYQPIMPYFVLQYPVKGGSYVYGQGDARFIQGGGQLVPHSPVGASGSLPAPRWFLDHRRGKRLPVGPQSNQKGNQRAPLQAQSFDSTSSETSSEE
ncbi:hypothetical protein FQN60_011835, partial [Etheostoma spectabile]